MTKQSVTTGTFSMGFKFQKLVCSGCLDLLMLSLNSNDITTVTARDIDSHCINFDNSKPDAIHWLKNCVLHYQGFI